MKNRRKLYLAVGKESDVLSFINENNLHKNFLNFKQEVESLSCTYFDDSVLFTGRYVESVATAALEILSLKLRHKMTYEETIVIYGLGDSFKTIERVIKVADRFFYDVEVLFFNDDYNKVQNLIETGKYVLNHSSVSDSDSSIHSLFLTCDEVKVNLDNYKKLYVFGDVHGCQTQIKNFEEKFGWQDDCFYIFLGDYIDRGEHNAETFQFVVDNIDKENFIFCLGNHEKGIYRHFINDSGKNIFRSERYQELKAIGMSDKTIFETYDKMKMFFAAEFKGRNLFFCHAGICDLPERPHLETGFVYTNGNRSFAHNVDVIFDINQRGKDEKDRWTLFHGHRNLVEPFNLDSRLYSHSLEFKVERGGYLGVAKIGKKIDFYFINEVEVKNNKDD